MEVKTSLRLGLSVQIAGQGLLKGNYKADICYNNLRSYYLVHLVDFKLYGKVVHINKLFPPNDPHKQNIKTL